MGEILWFFIEIISFFVAVYVIDCVTDLFAKGRELTLYVDGKEVKYRYVTYTNKLLYVKDKTGKIIVLKDWVILDKESLFHYMFRQGV